MAQAGVTFERGGITFHGSTGQARAGTAGSQPVAAEIPLGFSVENRITQIQWDATNHKLQIKKADVLIKNEDAEWTALLEFAEYDA